MSKDKIIRSNVFVIPNAEDSIYETGEDGKMKVNLRQTYSWYEGNKLCQEVRDVLWETDISIYKVGCILPGNIIKGIIDQPITGIYDYLLYNNEDVVCDNDGNFLYTFWYYSANSKYEGVGFPVMDDSIETYLIQ